MNKSLVLLLLMTCLSVGDARDICYKYNDGGGCISRKRNPTIIINGKDPNGKDLAEWSDILIKVDYAIVDAELRISVTGDVDFVDLRYALHDAAGRKYANGALKEGLTTVGMGKYPSGVYLVTISNEETLYTEKIMK